MIIFLPTSGTSGIGQIVQTGGDRCLLQMCNSRKTNTSTCIFFSSFFNSLNVKLLFTSRIIIIEPNQHRISPSIAYCIVLQAKRVADFCHGFCLCDDESPQILSERAQAITKRAGDACLDGTRNDGELKTIHVQT